VFCDTGACVVTCSSGAATKCPDGTTMVCPGTAC
jgi:hypothetical protein